MELKVGIQGREEISLTYEVKAGRIQVIRFFAVGPLEFLAAAAKWRGSLGFLSDLKTPSGKGVADLLLREMSLRIQGTWAPPHSLEIELCHCRAVQARKIDEAILAGAHSRDLVKQWTSASTGCGTCGPDIDEMIRYRLSN